MVQYCAIFPNIVMHCPILSQYRPILSSGAPCGRNLKDSTHEIERKFLILLGLLDILKFNVILKNIGQILPNLVKYEPIIVNVI